MTTTREFHERGLRDHLAPALRLLGLSGGRRTFALPDPTHWAMVGVVERRADGRVRYTFDLSLVSRADWSAAAFPGPHPDPRAVYGIESWRSRIGELLPVREDVWWEVLPGPRWQVALDDSVAAVRHYGLPELRRRLDLERGGGSGETYLSADELEQVNTTLLAVPVARIQRAELVGTVLVLTGAWTLADAAARTVLRGVAQGFLSAEDERFAAVHCADTLSRPLWDFERP
ncbi:hypothetical protein [Kitasatospora purpeofusca]|uniref:DUF4304 domain-containing protein n=1 Tax=Kitasatospora purpeofusca TaxID=67352 RepID=A0ABZ1U2C2_9ACTN|nr:hypothetical protein [Kitasatospora purpeofusca]